MCITWYWPGSNFPRWLDPWRYSRNTSSIHVDLASRACTCRSTWYMCVYVVYVCICVYMCVCIIPCRSVLRFGCVGRPSAYTVCRSTFFLFSCRQCRERMDPPPPTRALLSKHTSVQSYTVKARDCAAGGGGSGGPVRKYSTSCYTMELKKRSDIRLPDLLMHCQCHAMHGQ